MVIALRLYLARAGYTAGPLFRASINGSGGPLSYDAARHRWEEYCSAAELAFTVPGDRAGRDPPRTKPARPAPGVPRSSGCRPIGEQPDTPSAPAGHGSGWTRWITRGESLSARGWG